MCHPQYGSPAAAAFALVLLHRSKLAPLLSRIVAGVTADVEQLAQRLQSSEHLLRQEVDKNKQDPSAGASQGLCPIKVIIVSACVD